MLERTRTWIPGLALVVLTTLATSAGAFGTPPDNDPCTAPTTLMLPPAFHADIAEQDMLYATWNENDPTTACGLTTLAQSVWYQFYSPLPAEFFVTTCGTYGSTGAMPLVRLYHTPASDACDLSTPVACGLMTDTCVCLEPEGSTSYNACLSSQSALMTNIDGCTTYTLLVGNANPVWDERVSTLSLLYTFDPTRFYLPTTVTLDCQVSTVSFELTADGEPTTGALLLGNSCEALETLIPIDTLSTDVQDIALDVMSGMTYFYKILRYDPFNNVVDTVTSGCDCYEFTVPTCTPEPTVTPIVTPTASPTPPSPTPLSPTPMTPTPTPTNIVDEDFPETPGDTGGWIWINAVPYLSEPTSGVPGGRLTITATNAVDNFGIWQSPPQTIPGDIPTEIDADAVFRARYWVGTDVADRTLVPSIRMRTNDVNLTQSNALRINSSGEARLSPVPAAPSEYDLWFQSGEVASGWNYLAFEMINVGRENPVDSPDGLIYLDRVRIDKIGDTILTLAAAVPLQTFDFAGDSPEGWSPSDADIVNPFDQPTTSIENTRLQLTALNNTNTFGFWTSPEVTIPILQDWLIRAQFTCGSDVAAQDQVPQIRCRVEQSDFEQVSVVTVDSTGAGGNSPTAGMDRVYPVWLQIPDTASGLFLSFDLLDVGESDAPDATVNLDGVVVEAFVPADIIP